MTATIEVRGGRQHHLQSSVEMQTLCDTLSPIAQPASDTQDGMISSNALGGIDEQTIADTALVVEALAAFAGPPADLETHHERRAWELISSLAEDLSMTPSELLCIDAHRQSRTP